MHFNATAPSEIVQRSWKSLNLHSSDVLESNCKFLHAVSPKFKMSYWYLITISLIEILGTP